MRTRLITVGVIAALSSMLAPGAAAARGGPTIERWVDKFVLDPDPLFVELCEIETSTEVIERYTVTHFADGTIRIHTVRTYVPDDPRLPIEHGAATASIRPDGTRTIVGAPIQLRYRDGRRVFLDAGLVTFGPDDLLVTVRGPHPSLTEDLADQYCPA